MTSVPDFFDTVLLNKRADLIRKGINPYPYYFEMSHHINYLKQCADIFIISKEILFITGRILSQRLQGKVIFVDIQDESDKLQIYIKKNNVDEVIWNDIVLSLDIGDIIEVQGFLFKTKTNELTIHANKVTIISKCLVRIPLGKSTENKNFYHLVDPDIKYREKYIDWITDIESRKRILLRSKIISIIRKYMEKEEFLEVQTPVIEMVYGGAEARPFETNIWALSNQKAFLRISPELYLKRYIVGGFPKVYTICQNFRNEGIDKSHNPEFTMMEWYEAGTDYEFQMSRFENLISHVVDKLFGVMKITYQDVVLDFTPPWHRLNIISSLNLKLNKDILACSEGELKEICLHHKIEVPEIFTTGLLISLLFEKICQDDLIQPTFVLDHPIEISPLTKSKRGMPGFVERFEPYVMSMEIGNAYTELTDPVEQYERFCHQRAMDFAEGYQTHPIDMDFIKAIGCGMPPTGGVGLGIDRLIMLLTNSPTIKDVIPFPMMKPKIITPG